MRIIGERNFWIGAVVGIVLYAWVYPMVRGAMAPKAQG